MARFALNLISASAALAAANAAQAAADAAQGDADAAQADADTALSNASTADGKAVAAQAALLAGPGVPLLLAPTAITADGTEQAAPFTLSGITPTNGRKARINGVITVRVNDGGADDGERVMTLNANNLIMLRDSDQWTLYAKGDPTVESNGSDADPAGSLSGTLASWFADVDAYPQFGAYGSGDLALFLTPANTKDVIVEFDGTIADAGVSTV